MWLRYRWQLATGQIYLDGDHFRATNEPLEMPPKTMPMPAQPTQPTQPAPLQASLGVNPEYLLPHQREQYRHALQTVTDYQGHKAKEPNNSQLDAAIAEARGQLATLAAAAAQHEKLYPTPKLFQQYVNEQRQNLARRTEGANPNVALSSIPREHVLILSAKNQQLTNLIKEIDASLKRPDLSEADQTKLRAEYTRHIMEQEVVKNLFHNKAVPGTIAAAVAAVQAGVSLVDPTPVPPIPPVSQSQAGTPTVRPALATSSISMASQPTLPPVPSMGQLPRPSVNTAVPAPRPTLSGGYAVGNPLLGTTSPAGMPHAFHLSQDGDTRLLSKRKLQDLVKSIDPDERLEPDVEEVHL
jgi:Transcription initiation factor TFIID subunit A